MEQPIHVNKKGTIHENKKAQDEINLSVYGFCRLSMWK